MTTVSWITLRALIVNLMAIPENPQELARHEHALLSLCRTWTSRTGVDWPTYKLLFKDTIAPAIGLAANQATPWSNVFGTLGFLVPMVSIISRPSPPRAEFLRIWSMSIVGTCISAAVTALALFHAVKAREHSDNPVKDTAYNATASTVAAIWLIAQTYVISAVRYNYPETVWAAPICLIFSNYGIVYAVQFGTINAAYLFLQQLLLAHLVGLGISAGVSLLIFPTSSREVYFNTTLACIREMQSALRTHVKLMDFATRSADNIVSSELEPARKQHAASLESFHTKLAAQIKSARNELGFGILTPADLNTLHQLVEEVLIPLIGLCRVADVMNNALNDDRNSKKTPSDPFGPYRKLLKAVVEPFSQSCVACDTAWKFVRRASVSKSVAARPTRRARTTNHSLCSWNTR